MTSTRILAAGGVLVLVIAGCGSGGSSAPTPAPVPSVTAPSSASTSGVSPTSAAPPVSTASTTSVPYSNVPTSASPATPSGELMISDVRAGTHSGYDRVVIELTGGEPGELTWTAQYDVSPHTQGKGDAIELPGSAILRVSVYGLTYPPPGASTPHGLQADSAQGSITGVYVDPVFEAQAHVYVGLDVQRDFHVVEFDSPTRIVIDFKT